MNRYGSKGGGGAMCPLFCCLVLNKCCGGEMDEEDYYRRPLMKEKHVQQYNNYNVRRTKPKSTSKRNRNRSAIADPNFVPPSPVLHSGLKRMPFPGTLSDLTEEESGAFTASSNIDNQSFFQREEPTLLVISEYQGGGVEERAKPVKKSKDVF